MFTARMTVDSVNGTGSDVRKVRRPPSDWEPSGSRSMELWRHERTELFFAARPSLDRDTVRLVDLSTDRRTPSPSEPARDRHSVSAASFFETSLRIGTGGTVVRSRSRGAPPVDSVRRRMVESSCQPPREK